MEPNKFFPEQIINEVINLTPGHPSYGDSFKSKLQVKIYPSNKCFKQPEKIIDGFHGTTASRIGMTEEELVPLDL